MECVRERQTPKVSGEAGRQALEVAWKSPGRFRRWKLHERDVHGRRNQRGHVGGRIAGGHAEAGQEVEPFGKMIGGWN